MPQGRPPLGPAIVDRFEAPALQKRRAKTILEVISGRKTVEAACAELGVERARYYQLQDEFVEAGIAGLAPRPPGRAAAPPPSPAELENRRLKEELRDLKLERHAAEIRAEIAETLPHVLKKAGQKKRRRPW